MGLFSKLLNKRNKEQQQNNDYADNFRDLIQVYFQSIFASQFGITQIKLFPELVMFRRKFKVPSANNRLGVAEKKESQRMLMEIYGVQEIFFKEIDASIRRKCRTANDINTYLPRFQSFTQNLLMVITNVNQWKLRAALLVKKVLLSIVKGSVNDIMTKSDWKDNGIRKTCVSIRKSSQSLGFSPEWMTEYAFRILLLARKQPKSKMDNN